MRLLCASNSEGQAVKPSHLSAILEAYRPDLEPYRDIYRHLHSEPELSNQECNTASFVSNHLTRLGYEVIVGIGGTGVAGVLRNGNGRTILLRSELDALPVLEETGLPYASKKCMKDESGKSVPVMQAHRPHRPSSSLSYGLPVPF